MTNPIQFSASSLHISPLTVPNGVTVQDVFSGMASQPWAQLLDSGGSKASKSRFDILLWAPAIVLTCKDYQTTLEDRRGTDVELITTNTSPIDVAMALTADFEASIDQTELKYANDLPFVLGLAGFISYDYGRYLETMPSINANEYACPDFAAGLYDRAIIYDNALEQFFFCRLDYVPEPDIATLVNDKSNTAPASEFALTSHWQSNLTKQQYLNALNAVHDYLVAGDCYQVNYAQRFSAGFTGSSWEAYKRLTNANKAPFSAFMNLPECSIISVSPERFIQCRNGHIETKPIKGTRPRFADPVEDAASAQALLSAEKDRAENLMIVDLLRNDISKHSVPGSVKVPELFSLESYPAVHHMVSKIQSQLAPGSHPLQLLAACFPGGSITGAPKIRAMEIIEELEPSRRAIYCGSFFYFGIRQDLDSSICIRTVLAENNTLYCWAGGGIVLDSVAEEEFEETLAKVAKILPVLEQTFAKS
ncbi:aminodeoxychorismate synthase component I [Aestuariibacter sp. GS-14]|uniref:aminodeoxychorismate synthase component I n=1 Tax=Aestuariibacter sp. GS-14 TaxID=2590670 RepID=UPI00112E9D21|nr:aminodeoxychorismate synthase component I [Aestuariibacter sp. GS-14]TPV60031.1 aminodeoxychorismate synthase component I [Aestuariibacter sp. GS-14]